MKFNDVSEEPTYRLKLLKFINGIMRENTPYVRGSANLINSYRKGWNDALEHIREYILIGYDSERR